ncbi:MAG: chemotaxis protein CheY [Noviherbaspirillum sp.]|nr:chemotaxis protein CheY [Noviherbaspirillum sp.]
MNAAAPAVTLATHQPARILCVDDEPNILSSLRRLFRSQGYEVLTADSGASGLKLLERENVDLIISDMRMPEMDGAHFLEHARCLCPDALRLLLTGYGDVQSILNAINRGEIYRYITKPWDDTDILLVVWHALERKALEEERRRLEGLTRSQNEELKALNAELESRVKQRTAELTQANEKLKTSFLTSIKVFSNLIETRGGNLAGHSRRVADLARKIALKMGLGTQETQDVFIASLLHNIGKIGFSDEMLSMPVWRMKGDCLALYRKHPARGEEMLMPLEDLRDAAGIIRSQHERFDGEGFPDGLSGFNIPVGARILALASDYDNLQMGVLVQRELRPEEAAPLIIQSRGKRYDPVVVEAFQEIVSGRSPVIAEALQDEAASPADLRGGMIVARDLLNSDGSLLLSAGHKLTEHFIEQIIRFEKSTGSPLTIHVRKEGKKP